MIDITDIKNTFNIKKTKDTDEAKDKIHSLIEEEEIHKSKEASVERGKAEQIKFDKSRLLIYSVMAIFLLVSSAGLFYAAFVSKTDTEMQYQQRIKNLAARNLNDLNVQITSAIDKQNKVLFHSLMMN